VVFATVLAGEVVRRRGRRLHVAEVRVVLSRQTT
jgi:hypothetical protein